MTRQEAYQALTVSLKNPNLIKHSLACEAAMKGICHFLYPNIDDQTLDVWGITGLLHDGDYELSIGNPELHGILITQKLPLPPEIAQAIKSHNFENTKVQPVTPMDWAITTCDQLTGLIVAATLVSPTKKIADVTPEFVMSRFNDKSFAKGASRQSILYCEEKLNIKLGNFITIVLNSMKEISNELSL